jgi:hypothetical protein
MSPLSSSHPLNWKQTILFSTGAIASFHLAYNFSRLSFLIAAFLFCLFRLADVSTPRKAFYIGFVIGIAIYAPELGFFWNIFKGAAIALWAVLAFWIALFLLLSNLTIKNFGHKNFAVIAPALWIGLEYFRSELYYLRFSWLNAGYVFSHQPEIVKWLGVYGVGFALMAAIAWLTLLRPKLSRIFGAVFILILIVVTNTPILKSSSPISLGNSLSVAGIQMEFPAEVSVPAALDKLANTFPEADLLVLSEYTFDGPVPERVKDWCKANQKYLVVGGKDPLPDGNYFNTAFVIGPNG